MLSLSDESLLSGLTAGDAEASSAFVRRFQGRVFGLALAILGDAATAEEVAQEVFIRAWRYGAAYDSRRGRVDTWLLTITRNLATDVRRLRRSHPVDPDALIGLAAAADGPDPEELSVAAERARRLRDALVALPREQRRALVAASFGWTAREISESEGIPLGTTKTRIRAGLQKLRLLMEVGDER